MVGVSSLSARAGHRNDGDRRLTAASDAELCRSSERTDRTPSGLRFHHVRTQLDPDNLMAIASSRTGARDFGGEDFLEGLNVLIAAIVDDPHITELAREAQVEELVRPLIGRLRSEAAMSKSNGDVGTPISRPLFILGLPRTGTTALHKLIAQDPSVQSLPYWLGVSPEPRPPQQSWYENPHFLESKAYIDGLYSMNPAFRTMHDMAPDEPDECRLLRMQSFADATFASTLSLPPYVDWLLSHDKRDVYDRYRRNLQLIGHHDTRRWVLKCPGHMLALDAVLDEFPDACIVQTHRAPEEAIPSVCSMCYSFGRFMQPSLSREAYGRYQLDLYQRIFQHAFLARRRAALGQFYDVDFWAFVADPIAEIERIYDHFNFDLSDGARDAMVRWHESRPRGQQGEHRYSARDFGLDEDEIRERLGWFDRFGSP